MPQQYGPQMSPEQMQQYLTEAQKDPRVQQYLSQLQADPKLQKQLAEQALQGQEDIKKEQAKIAPKDPDADKIYGNNPLTRMLGLLGGFGAANIAASSLYLNPYTLMPAAVAAAALGGYALTKKAAQGYMKLVEKPYKDEGNKSAGSEPTPKKEPERKGQDDLENLVKQAQERPGAQN